MSDGKIDAYIARSLNLWEPKKLQRQAAFRFLSSSASDGSAIFAGVLPLQIAG